MKASSELRILRNIIVVCAAALAIAAGAAVVSMSARGDFAIGGAPDSAGQKLPVITRSILMPGYNLEELVARSDLIVSGVVTSHADSVLIEPSDGGDLLFFTDIIVAVDEVFLDRAGCFAEGAGKLTVRTEGGQGDYVEMEVEGAPAFDEGSRYLLFLYRLDDGTYYNTQGDHYYVVGVATGAWKEAGDGSFASPCWRPDGLDRATPADVRSAASEAPAEPLHSTSGDSVPFARALTGDEQRAYEQGVVDKYRNGSSMSSKVHIDEGIER